MNLYNVLEINNIPIVDLYLRLLYLVCFVVEDDQVLLEFEDHRCLLTCVYDMRLKTLLEQMIVMHNIENRMWVMLGHWDRHLGSFHSRYLLDFHRG